MQPSKDDKAQLRRTLENENLVTRMRRGETLSLVAPQATWWPPREIIKKDAKEISRLYGDIPAPRHLTAILTMVD